MSRRSRTRSEFGTIDQVFLVEIPPSTPMCSRPLKPSASGDLLSDLLDEYDHNSQNGRYSDPGNLSTIANKAFSLDAEVERVIKTTNYDRRRFVVLIKLVLPATRNTSNVDYITGFTDMYDFKTRDGGSIADIAPDTRIYFNNTVKSIHSSDDLDRRGRRVQIDRVNQVLGNRDQSWFDSDRRSGRRRRDDNEVTLTPYQMVQKLGARATQLEVTSGDIESTMTDKRNLLASTTMSNYEDRVPSGYLSRITEGLESASRSRRSNSSRANRNAETDTEYYGTASKKTGDSKTMSTPFFKALINQTDFDDDNFVTWEDLEKVFPELIDDGDDIVELLTIDRDSSNRGGRSTIDDILDPEDTESWETRTTTTTIANHVASSIPPLMADLMISEVSLIITNDNRRGKIEVTPGDMIRSIFKEFDDPDALDVLCDRVKEFVIDGMPFTKAQFYIDGVFSIIRSTQVAVSFDGDESVPYNYASYSDAVASPLITIDKDRVTDILDELSEINEHIYNRNGGRSRRRSEDYDLNEDDIRSRR